MIWYNILPQHKWVICHNYKFNLTSHITAISITYYMLYYFSSFYHGTTPSLVPYVIPEIWPFCTYLLDFRLIYIVLSYQILFFMRCANQLSIHRNNSQPCTICYNRNMAILKLLPSFYYSLSYQKNFFWVNGLKLGPYLHIEI